MAKKSVKKKVSKKKPLKKKSSKKNTEKKSSRKKINKKEFPTLKIRKESDIASDFAVKAYKKFDKVIKSIVLFGSTAKNESTVGSDIDIIFILDDVTIAWDQELIAWYREELEKLAKENPYSRNLHINTIKLSAWWTDLMKGDPVLINILRYGEALIDLAGFFEPLKALLAEGKIKSTPEAIYTALRRAPEHLQRSKLAELNSVEGIYWAMVDSAHAALISANVAPPSPEHIPMELKINFVDSKKIKEKYVFWFRDILLLHKEIMHGKKRDLRGVQIDDWQDRAEEFIHVMAEVVKNNINA